MPGPRVSHAGSAEKPRVERMGNSFEDFGLAVLATTIDAVVVEVDGVLDLYSAPRLKSAVLDSTPPGHAAVVDLLGVDFVDSSALAMIVSVDRELRSRGGTLVLVASDAPGTRALELSGIARTIPVVPTRAAALVRLERDEDADRVRGR